MRLDGTMLDLHTIANDRAGDAMVGWRRRIEVREDVAHISFLASPETAGIGIGEPGHEVSVYCEPYRVRSVGPVNRAGWLALEFLEPNHVYWLELRAFGGISIEREDGDPGHVWYWPLPIELWRKIQCG
ncbi:hypothetical protein SEA_SATIS_189 [Streptomyces phage Satis]|nr:hypothetical protein SEA_SATIS_189 [Streptomyces phage Satis]QBZ72086.1 hypothetical protein SEA_KRADAL_190 [Streptomyces phage Kradal]QPL14506.1 hypothetical protein SEA_EHYELIMAYOE_191 [Streptomyces phage EhyElimayoE]